MKQLLVLIRVFVASIALQAQGTEPPSALIDTLPEVGLRAVSNGAFQVGERLRYRIHYGFIDAGEAVLEVKNAQQAFDGRKAFHIIGTGRSLGAFDWVFKVRDRYETFVDKEGLFPYRFIRNVSEGGYKIFQDYQFIPQKRGLRTHEKKEYLTPAFIQDLLSAFYYARTIDFSSVKQGDTFEIMTFVDGEVYPLRIKFVGSEKVKLRKGTFQCMKFVPIIQEGRIWKDEEDLSVWVTNDANKIPILIKSDILVGSLKIEVVEYENLMNPIAKVD